MSETQRPHALVTGASQGIGKEIAHVLAEKGYRLTLVARNSSLLQQLATELKQAYQVPVDVFVCDLSVAHAAAKLYEHVARDRHTLDVLVNNAGFGMHGPFFETPLAKVQEIQQLNMTTLTELTHLFGRDMQRRGQGRILNVASTAAFQPGPFMASYFASKAYVLSLSAALASESAFPGFSVTTLCPGVTRTSFFDRPEMQSVVGLNKIIGMDARKVARIGVQGMLRGRAVVIPGPLNKAGVIMQRLFPRQFVVKIIGFFLRN